MNNLIKVTKEEFYKKIGPLDVMVSSDNKYSYFRLRNYTIIGMTDLSHLVDDPEYFLTKEAI